MWTTWNILIAAGAIIAIVWALRRVLPAILWPFSFRDRVVLITGGSRGLGLLMARRLADEGAKLALCARNQQELDAAAVELRERGAVVETFACDLIETDAPTKLVASVHQLLGPIDVLINNAGIIQVGPLESMTRDDYEQALDLHLWAPHALTEAVLPAMRRRGGGRIVNISSIGGRIAVPHLHPYSASKFALVGYSQGLHSELAPRGIWVTTVCPGLMRTGSTWRALFKGEHRAEHAWFSILGSLPLVSMNADRAAAQILRACRYRRAHITLSFLARAAEIMNAVAPGLTHWLLRTTSRVLPKGAGHATPSRPGIESTSRWSPSWLTWLGDKAAHRNNELVP